MIQDIKFELFDKNTVEADLLLATEHVNINMLDTDNAWGQFIWINFYTATNTKSSAGALMVKNIIDGN